MQPFGVNKAPDAFRTISEVAEELDIPQHVLRFWETRFTSIRPLKRGGGRRYYRPDDVELLKGIRQLLYGQGYTIKGVQRILKEEGARVVQDVGQGGTLPPTRAELETVRVDDLDRSPVDRASHGNPISDVAAGQTTRSSPGSRAAVDGAHLTRLRAALADLHECQRALNVLKRA